MLVQPVRLLHGPRASEAWWGKHEDILEAWHANVAIAVF